MRLQRFGVGMIKLLAIAILFNPYILLANCKTTLADIDSSQVVAFKGEVLWEWNARTAVGPGEKPMPEGFKDSFKDVSSAGQFIYKGELHLLLVAIGNLALLRFEDNVVVWSGETSMEIESAILTGSSVVALDSSGFETVIGIGCEKN